MKTILCWILGPLIILSLSVWLAPHNIFKAPEKSSFALDLVLKEAVLDKVLAEQYAPEELERRSREAYKVASEFSIHRGEGRKAWLSLLQAVDLDRGNADAFYNLVKNYEQLHESYLALAYSEMMDSKLSTSMEQMIFDDLDKQKFKNHFKKTAASVSTIKLPEPCKTLAFQTYLASWSLSDHLPAQMNEEIYRKSIEAYEMLKANEGKGLSPTDINHKFFTLQMQNLEGSSSWWGMFADIPGFNDLVQHMRSAAAAFLEDHGMNPTTALRKASHPMVIWASVHTEGSVHQPHVTDDALIGGVYYVNVPKGSGKLRIFDPRGKSPLDLAQPTSDPLPPFFRTVGVEPSESKLVLFPGWLVHSVEASSKDLGDLGRYRVSLSLNLKGEWQDTASLHHRFGTNC